MKNTKIITIKEKDVKKRIDKFLAERIKDYSRSFWGKGIKDGLVLVDDKIVTPHFKLKVGNKIKIKERKVEKVVEQKIVDMSPDKSIKLNIIFENDNFLIIDKPAGLIVHPSSTAISKTLVNGLLAYHPEISGVGEDELRPGIVHRLDRDVSGVMVVAKNQKTFLFLKDQFKKRKVKKEYTALVHGVINKHEGEINLKIGRSKVGGLMSTGGEKHKDAKTLFWVLDRFKNYSLLKVKILTGRTHQIRVHLRSMERPVVGDRVYFLKKYSKFKDFDLDRVFLHSHKLGFYDLDGEWVEFISNLPRELSTIIKELKK